MSILISVSEIKLNGFTHPTPVTKLIGVPFISKIDAQGANSIVITNGKRGNEERLVSGAPADIISLGSGGFLDFILNLTVKADSRNQGLSIARTMGFNASDIIEAYADPSDANDSIVVVRDNEVQEDIVYTVDETVAAIQALLPTVAAASAVKVGTTLFVSSQGKTVAAGAARENLSSHFSSLTEAYNAANDGDLIVIYPGTYSGAGNLGTKDVSFYTYPGANMTGNTHFDDLGSTRNIRVYGGGVWNTSNEVVKVTAAASTVVFNAESVNCSTVTFHLENDATSIINVNGIITSSNGATMYIAGSGNYVITADEIGNDRTSNIKTTFNIRNTFDGTMVVNCRDLWNNTTLAGADVVLRDNGTVTGKATFNITGKAYQKQANSGSIFQIQSGTSENIVNGYIDGGAGIAIDVTNGGGSITHNGDATNDGTQPLIQSTTAVASNISLNGVYTSANDSTINITSTGAKLRLNGRIDNTSTTAGQKQGINLGAAANLILEDAIIALDGGAGTPNAVYAGAAQNAKIYKMVTNYTYNVNVTNIITGGLEVVDTDVE